MRDACAAMTTRYLVVDEVETFRHKSGVECHFRFRVWRGAGPRPIVLVSPARGPDGASFSPSIMTVALARYSVVLAGCPEGTMLHFEADTTEECGRPRVRQVVFEYMGNSKRLRLSAPSSCPYSWRALELVVGERIQQ